MGKPGIAIQKLLQEDPTIKYVLTVDAALKTRRVRTPVRLQKEWVRLLEALVWIASGLKRPPSTNEVQMLAFVAKMSEKEAITEIPKAVKDQSAFNGGKNSSYIGGLPEGTSVMVAGIGNTMGVA